MGYDGKHHRLLKELPRKKTTIKHLTSVILISAQKALTTRAEILLSNDL
jgi:hypothetical protein